MRDLMTLIIGLSLVFTGAFFLGYPIGLIIGRRKARKEILTILDDDSEIE